MTKTPASFHVCNWRKRKNMRKRFKRLTLGMKQMSIEQHSVKNVQRQVEARLRAVQEECDRLRDETDQIIRQSADTQTRLALMFDILKARERGDLDQAAQLTRSLREALGRDNAWPK